MVFTVTLYCSKQYGMKTTILLITANSNGINSDAGYLVGALLALAILCFLLYALVKPDKF
jgi:hypothetical protein